MSTLSFYTFLQCARTMTTDLGPCDISCWSIQTDWNWLWMMAMTKSIVLFSKKCYRFSVIMQTIKFVVWRIVDVVIKSTKVHISHNMVRLEKFRVLSSKHFAPPSFTTSCGVSAGRFPGRKSCVLHLQSTMERPWASTYDKGEEGIRTRRMIVVPTRTKKTESGNKLQVYKTRHTPRKYHHPSHT